VKGARPPEVISKIIKPFESLLQVGLVGIGFTTISSNSDMFLTPDVTVQPFASVISNS